MKLSTAKGFGLLLATGLLTSACSHAVQQESPPIERASQALETSCGVVSGTVAPGAPGDASTWAFSGKSGIGTSYEAYLNKQHSDSASTGTVSKVWFSVADGVLTETMWGLIHEAQIKDMQLVLIGDDFVDFESTATESTTEYLSTDSNGNPDSLAYKLTNTDFEGKYTIERHVFTNPDNQSVYVRTVVHSNTENLRAFMVLNPHVANTGSNDFAEVTEYGFHAWEGSTHLSLMSSEALAVRSVGFAGVSDGISDLISSQDLLNTYSSTGSTAGNVMAVGELPLVGTSTTVDFVLAFGNSHDDSCYAAHETLDTGYDTVLAKYNGTGDYIGWQDYLASLDGLADIRPSAGDGGALLNVSALVLKAQEDKTNSGALIASLSNPWGDTVSAETSATGYKAVWPRDFYQCAMALLALGDEETPLVSFEYLQSVQVGSSTPGNSGAGGWFLQKTHVDGTLEWFAVQLDQTAMPIMLGYKLWSHGVLSGAEAQQWYWDMLKPAAEFLANGGSVNLDWNTASITPPWTQQERWEEQAGYSPSTMAAVIAGLVSAASFADEASDAGAGAWYLLKAQEFSDVLEAYTFTNVGRWNSSNSQGNGQYYLRVTQNTDPNDYGTLFDRNGRGQLNEYEIIDGGFLELVRYGVRSPDNSHILDSLPEYDDTTLPDEFRVRYEFTDANTGAVYPGFRRYGDDGYGEDATTGGNYGAGGVMSSGQRGRVWPFFTGERGHYELAALMADGSATTAELDGIRDTYIKGMEYFANDGLMIPEQVWDGVGNATAHNYALGQGTNSATPLAWSHAEYVKLVRSHYDQQVWDHYPVVSDTIEEDDTGSGGGGGSSTVPVDFTCYNGTTYWGQSVYVVGSIPALGSWDPSSAVLLSPDSYPTWAGTIAVPTSTAVEWKCIKREESDASAGLVWQSGSNNTFNSGSTQTVSGSF